MTIGLLELLFLLAAWAIVPLGLSLLPDPPLLRAARRLHPVAAILATISFFVPEGPAAAGLVVPWMALNGLVALAGLSTLKEAFRGGVPSLLRTAAMLFPTAGGVHLVASRMGYPLAGFPEPIVLLTAIHFHYTAFAAPILASLAGRRLGRIAGLGLVGGTPLLAAGFLCSPRLKAAAVGVLVLSVIGVAIAQLGAARRLKAPTARLLLVVSSLSVIAGMILAAVYEHAFYTGRSWLSIPRMAWSHGLLNGVGFSLGGLLAWNIDRGGGSATESSEPVGIAPPRAPRPINGH
jgi:hypothetical protein